MVEAGRGRAKSFCAYVNLQTGTCTECYKPTKTCNQARPVAEVESDWYTLGYKATSKLKGAPSNGLIIKSIKKGRPIEVFIQYENSNDGHFFLIVGTLKERQYGDTVFTIADPLMNHTRDMSCSEINNWGHWQHSWIIAE